MLNDLLSQDGWRQQDHGVGSSLAISTYLRAVPLSLLSVSCCLEEGTAGSQPCLTAELQRVPMQREDLHRSPCGHPAQVLLTPSCRQSTSLLWICSHSAEHGRCTLPRQGTSSSCESCHFGIFSPPRRPLLCMPFSSHERLPTGFALPCSCHLLAPC